MSHRVQLVFVVRGNWRFPISVRSPLGPLSPALFGPDPQKGRSLGPKGLIMEAGIWLLGNGLRIGVPSALVDTFSGLWMLFTSPAVSWRSEKSPPISRAVGTRVKIDLGLG